MLLYLIKIVLVTNGKMFVRHIIIVYIEFSYPKLNPSKKIKLCFIYFAECM